MKNSFFSRFTPKEPKFFPLLKQLSEVLCEASVVLIESLQHDSPTERSDYYKKIKDLEREGDRLAHLIFDELGTTFITPFDREDILDAMRQLPREQVAALAEAGQLVDIDRRTEPAPRPAGIGIEQRPGLGQLVGSHALVERRMFAGLLHVAGMTYGARARNPRAVPRTSTPRP